MTFGINKDMCQFFVKEEERTIVCKIPNTTYKLIEYLDERFDWDDIMFDCTDKVFNELKMPGWFIGKAVCADNDEWDEELGKDIAFMRAKDKFYKCFFKRAQQYVNRIELRLTELCDEFNNIGEKVSTKMGDKKRSIDERLGD
jgi:hypothetical protein